jgi:DNA primase
LEALTQQQARLLKRYVSTVYSPTTATRRVRTRRSAGWDILKAEGLTVRVIVFPNQQDPDEFIRHSGKEAFDALKDDALALNAFSSKAWRAAMRSKTSNERERYAIAACRFIAGLTPSSGSAIKQLSKKTGYTLETLKAQGGTAGAALPRRTRRTGRSRGRAAQARPGRGQ